MKLPAISIRNQRGDTIVEVLISMTIISSILVGAFILANNSKLQVTNSREHDDAIKILESQLEEMRAYATSNSNPDQGVFITTAFCMYHDQPALTSTGNCVQDDNGNVTTQQPEYNVSIQCQNQCPDHNGGYLYDATVWWPQVTGHGNATESMYYRLYSQ
jgi:Tfp pilus assembly protein PilV